MTFHTEKDLKSKNVRWKKNYILAKDVNNFSKKKIGLKKAYFFVRPNSGSWSQIAWIFLTKYFLPEKINLLTSLQAEIRGGPKRQPQPLLFGKRPSLLRVKMVISLAGSPGLFKDYFLSCRWARVVWKWSYLLQVGQGCMKVVISLAGGPGFVWRWSYLLQVGQDCWRSFSLFKGISDY